jgi:hypothetical protein
MTYRNAISGAAAYSLAGLVWGSAVAATILGVATAIEQRSALAFVPAFGWFISIALVVGLVLVSLIGIPLFALLRSRGLASYLAAAFVGLIPAAITWFAFPPAAPFVVLFGLCVGLCTQLLASQSERDGHAL